MRYLTAEPLPDGVYDAVETAIIRYAQKSTRMQPIDAQTYGDLSAHFSNQQIIDLCLTVGLSNLVTRFHATFLTDVDAATLAEVEAGNAEPGVCPIALPARPLG